MMTKKKEKCRGYITGKSIEQGFVPQQVQNIVVRNYCKNNDIEYLWSAVEFLMPNSYALEIATANPLALNEPVGFKLSSLIHIFI